MTTFQSNFIYKNTPRRPDLIQGATVCSPRQIPHCHLLPQFVFPSLPVFPVFAVLFRSKGKTDLSFAPKTVAP